MYTYRRSNDILFCLLAKSFDNLKKFYTLHVTFLKKFFKFSIIFFYEVMRSLK